MFKRPRYNTTTHAVLMFLMHAGNQMPLNYEDFIIDINVEHQSEVKMNENVNDNEFF